MYGPATTAGWTSQPFGSNPGGYNPPGGHTGRDRALDIGTTLAARGDGTVLHAGYLPGTWSDNPWLLVPGWAGFVVVIDYGPFISIYAHCSGSPVAAGQRVSMGQYVADSGNSGSATSGPHLHEEALPDGWNVMNGTYGRCDPDLFGSITLAPAGTITPISTPEPQPQEEDEMKVLATNGRDGKVYIGDGIIRRHVWTVDTMTASQWLATNGILGPFYKGGEVQTIPDLNALGIDLEALVGKA
jgi:murein DD-endopeptidase MepM/ murein hydrolase activator NlpD